MHRRLLGDVWRWAATYRRTEKNIGIDPAMVAVEVHTALTDARYWLEHATWDPVEQALRLHHRLVFMHPFPNGNSRSARIVADVVMKRLHGRQAINWSGGHEPRDVSGVRRQQYIAALWATDGGDFAPLLAFAGRR